MADFCLSLVFWLECNKNQLMLIEAKNNFKKKGEEFTLRRNKYLCDFKGRSP